MCMLEIKAHVAVGKRTAVPLFCASLELCRELLSLIVMAIRRNMTDKD